ncbi:hypothetical protein AVEN_81675-1 [Araneus ventricosus]|uniref:Uncharacterized protein n=1 Tax=Araneus ventricosus TaxID=182803 RepID=A0A4Y2VW67_ARAVE|nr:hypothetical protein AVEN_208294-1 [Araneus ventricosus]GBO28921.1 hypothetical protein AVEN_81675-1 [Araneus ventricosus]
MTKCVIRVLFFALIGFGFVYCSDCIYFNFDLPSSPFYNTTISSFSQLFIPVSVCAATQHSRDGVVPTTMPVIKQRDTNEDCAKTLSSTENKLAEDANTFFIEKSVKDRRPLKQGVKRVNGNLLPTKATQLKKQGNHFFNN